MLMSMRRPREVRLELKPVETTIGDHAVGPFAPRGGAWHSNAHRDRTHASEPAGGPNRRQGRLELCLNAIKSAKAEGTGEIKLEVGKGSCGFRPDKGQGSGRVFCHVSKAP